MYVTDLPDGSIRCKDKKGCSYEDPLNQTFYRFGSKTNIRGSLNVKDAVNKSS